MALLLEIVWVDLTDLASAEHRAIADAILARDAAAAAAAARAHVQSSLNNMQKIQQVYTHRRQI
jgi:DNA-binding FadR family transcriptional regulator